MMYVLIISYHELTLRATVSASFTGLNPLYLGHITYQLTKFLLMTTLPCQRTSSV